ncbi:MAG: hypothetical protein JWQ71_4545 [Pedosphaera sp.]|nr:hypothetical protein [Pedosphaera sp.]
MAASLCENEGMIGTELKPHSTNRVIRNQATGRFFVEQGRGAWVESPDSATKYKQLTTMVEVCRRFGLEDVELVTKLDGNQPVEMIGIN